MIPLSPSDAQKLTTFLRDVDFTQENLEQRLNLVDIPSRRLRNMPRLLDRTQPNTALNLLLRWFFVGVPVENTVAAALLPEWTIGLCSQCGLLRSDGELLIPGAMLLPFGDLYIASDHPWGIETSERADLVLWPNPTSRLLSRFTIRRHSRATLDLGTGNGVEALIAASHSERVIATDLNPRAIEFTAFNAALNGLANVLCLTGDAFVPVQDSTFDLVVANPPFFISPANRYLFCDNPLDLDELCHRLVRQAPEHLNQGGYFQMVCEWAEVEGQPWQERLAEWLKGTGCDAWVLKGYTEQPWHYAEQRIRETNESGDNDAERYTEYMNYYRDHGVKAIHGGLVAMRRRDADNWIMLQEASATPKGPFGDAVMQVFEAQDFLRSHATRDEMLNARPKLDPAVRLHQRFDPGLKGWERGTLELRRTDGFGSGIELQPLVAEFVGACNGERTLRELIGALATQVNAGPEIVERECLEVMRNLVEHGFMNGRVKADGPALP
jgi:methylase of polypeptide subunit release factors